MNYNYAWYPVVLNIVTRYPDLHKRESACSRQQMYRYSAWAQMRRDPPPEVTDAAENPLSRAERREYLAVVRAIRKMQELPFGEDVLQIVELTDWKRSHNQWGAALQLDMPRHRIQEYHIRFIFLTAFYLGYPVRASKCWKSWWPGKFRE